MEEVIKYCGKCKNGFIYLDDFGFTVKKCECLITLEKQWKIDRLFKDAKIPKRYLDFTYENLLLDKEIVERVKNHSLKDSKNSLFLFGGYGSGKTTLAIVYQRAKFEEGVSSIFISVPDLLDHIRSAW